MIAVEVDENALANARSVVDQIGALAARARELVSLGGPLVSIIESAAFELGAEHDRRLALLEAHDNGADERETVREALTRAKHAERQAMDAHSIGAPDAKTALKLRDAVDAAASAVRYYTALASSGESRSSAAIKRAGERRILARVANARRIVDVLISTCERRDFGEPWARLAVADRELAELDDADRALAALVAGEQIEAHPLKTLGAKDAKAGAEPYPTREDITAFVEARLLHSDKKRKVAA